MRLIGIALLAVIPSVVAGQADSLPARERPLYGYKDGATATVFSLLIPGVGQMYARKPVKGLFILGASVGLFRLGQQTTARDCERSHGLECGTPILTLPGALGFMTYLTGIISANGDVEEFNSKHARGIVVVPEIDSRRVGLRVAFTP